MVTQSLHGTGSSFAKDGTDVSGTLYFRASDGTSDTGLWKSDGTTAGTVLVKNIYPSLLTHVNGTLFFRAYDETSGTGLWEK